MYYIYSCIVIYINYTITRVAMWAKRRTNYLDVTSLRPPTTTTHISDVLLSNSPSMLDLLS